MNTNLQRFSQAVRLFHSLGGAARAFRHRATAPATALLAPAEAEVVRLCGTDARGRHLGDIVAESPFDEDETLSMLRDLVERGVVEHA